MRNKIIISLVCVFTGLMIAIQFQTTREPEERDTRDLWEIRTQLQSEQKIQLQLYQEIAETEKVLEQYKANSDQDLIETLSTSINELEEQAGLTEVTGNGVVITLKPIVAESNALQKYPTVTPELLNRLVNELNVYGAKDIAIGPERIVDTTPIRNVNGETYVNNHELPSVPIEIKVLSNDPKRLLDFVQVSQSRDEFALEYLDLSVEIDDNITLPKYDGMINLEGLDVVENNEMGDE